jgi:hypothetical protein
MSLMCFDGRVNLLGRVKAAEVMRGALVIILLPSLAPYPLLVPSRVDVLVVCRSHG